MSKLTHIDNKNQPKMVDVSAKEDSERIAEARGEVKLGSKIISLLQSNELNMPKGPVFQTAIIAGTMAVKRTAELIPFCHPLPINGCKFSIKAIDDKRIEVLCKVKTFGKTGVEMEALTGVSAACLTVYDMCKALSHDIVISDIQLILKKGGKSDYQK